MQIRYKQGCMQFTGSGRYRIRRVPGHRVIPSGSLTRHYTEQYSCRDYAQCKGNARISTQSHQQIPSARVTRLVVFIEQHHTQNKTSRQIADKHQQGLHQHGVMRLARVVIHHASINRYIPVAYDIAGIRTCLSHAVPGCAEQHSWHADHSHSDS